MTGYRIYRKSSRDIFEYVTTESGASTQDAVQRASLSRLTDGELLILVPTESNGRVYPVRVRKTTTVEAV